MKKKQKPIRPSDADGYASGEVTEPVSAEYLIQTIAKSLTPPATKYKIGISGKGHNIETGDYNYMFYNPLNSQAVMEAYNHFVSMGMQPITPVPEEPKWLYLYNTRGRKIRVCEGIAELKKVHVYLRMKYRVRRKESIWTLADEWQA